MPDQIWVMEQQLAVTEEQLAVATARAQAWRDLALGVRRVLGEVMKLAGEAGGHLEFFSGKAGWTITQAYCDLAANLSRRLEVTCAEAHVTVPDILEEEMRLIDAEEKEPDHA